MEFGANKTPVAVIKEGAFGGTYFRDIYPGINGKWYRKSWKEFNQLKDILTLFDIRVILTLVGINMMLNAEYR